MKNLLSLAPIGAAIIATAALAQGLPPSTPNAVTEAGKAPPPPALTDAKTGTMYVSENSQDLMSSRLVGAKVVSPGDDAIGEIADLMLSQDGSLRAVVISVGGVLGVGARYVAVAPAALKMTRNDDKSIKVVLAASKEDLKAAPAFKYEAKPS